MPTTRSRPTSPHLFIWKWGISAITSITHRATGLVLSTVATAMFVWWLAALASGPEAYATFYAVASSWFGILIGIGVTWALFQHMASGIRHLFMDVGAGYELRTAKMTATLTYVFSVCATAAFWIYALLLK